MSDKKATNNNSPDLPEDLTLEQALERLENIVSDLEGDELSLEDALEAYEEGVTISEFCGGRLDEAELRMEEITPQANSAGDKS